MNESEEIGKIHKAINKYLEPVHFNLAKLFESTYYTPREQEVFGVYDGKENAVIFGGAIRDAIIGAQINDLDILVKSKSYWKICHFLQKEGFSQIEQDEDGLAKAYKELHIIHEPTTFIKNGVKIQLIRPARKTEPSKNDPNDRNDRLNLLNFIANCDIRCCSLFLYTDMKRLKCNINSSAFNDCLKKEIFVEIGNNMLVLRNIEARVEKFLSRGWKVKNKAAYKEFMKGNGIKIRKIVDKIKIKYLGI